MYSYDTIAGERDSSPESSFETQFTDFLLSQAMETLV
jgi:hypothetical protein